MEIEITENKVKDSDKVLSLLEQSGSIISDDNVIYRVSQDVFLVETNKGDDKIIRFYNKYGNLFAFDEFPSTIRTNNKFDQLNQDYNHAKFVLMMRSIYAEATMFHVKKKLDHINNLIKETHVITRFPSEEGIIMKNVDKVIYHLEHLYLIGKLAEFNAIKSENENGNVSGKEEAKE